MIVYEVNLDIDAGLRGEYLPWLQAHVAEMLHFDGFDSAAIEAVLDPGPAAGRLALCVRYAVRNPACLDAYLAEHAPRMREAGIARFGDGVRAHRRILHAL